MAEIYLKPGREKSVIRRHPWVFSGAVLKIGGDPKIGETVDILTSDGNFLARAAFNPKSNIICRIWTWNIDQQVDEDFFEDKLVQAIKARDNIQNLINSDSYRIVHGESDGIPGMILDRYGELLVVQYLSAGVEYWKKVLTDVILRQTQAEVIYERSDQDVRELEGLPVRSGLLYGNFHSEEILIKENDVNFLVDVVNGHKTGFYLDQRENRAYARELSSGLNILDCFSYTGGFAINALVGSANHVTLVDSSANALQKAKQNLVRNKLDLNKVEFFEQDVFKYLRLLRDSGKIYDLVILDPPKFAPTTAQVERAARGYKDINLLALKLLRPGGYLLTFSCSGGVSEELFQKIITGAAQDIGADAIILKRLHQAIDHPVALNFPEGAYLKGFVIQRKD